MNQNLGLYVYGGLLMALSFVSGHVTSDRATMAMAIIACAAAALTHAFSEVCRASGWISFSSALLANVLALASWFITAAAFVSATITLL
jgi:hypothetical protein